MVSNSECSVSSEQPMPKGYRFVRRGNAYITRYCRKQAHLEGHIVYVVAEGRKQTGIRVPKSIYLQALENHHLTKDARARNLHKKDTKLETDFRNSILSLFPQIPAKDVTEAIQQTMRKHSGRVGRTTKLDIAERTRLAVRAHIRHRHTDYDELLRRGVQRDRARTQINQMVDKIACEWRGGPRRTPSQHGQPAIDS
ncbi:uncharacterized protein F4812DRAFT_245222 [Daldinia caldariorum]|uniref:uncharacterized protein n=1 Tax=Daldinia caldariorum TaxID=326644 RepID=UPI002007DDCC|nr:uncharacterized protein F4812DRAFT_245222 [Daldinia caldariorum]KAI1463373.1 hypothetical protein F4812DRAFT_245222 [Daldinia caldariorum]